MINSCDFWATVEQYGHLNNVLPNVNAINGKILNKEIYIDIDWAEDQRKERRKKSWMDKVKE